MTSVPYTLYVLLNIFLEVSKEVPVMADFERGLVIEFHKGSVGPRKRPR